MGGCLVLDTLRIVLCVWVLPYTLELECDTVFPCPMNLPRQRSAMLIARVILYVVRVVLYTAVGC
jgi:hypothetical protein